MGKKLIVPILTVIVGVTWLLNVQNIMPGVDWMWTVSLAAVGILTLAVGGINKLTIVIGPLLLVASICSLLRQTNRLSVDHEIPILVIAIGILLLIAQLSKLQLPEAMQKHEEAEKESSRK